MPQITYIPSQQRDTTLTDEAFRRMFSGIEDHIRFRRESQARKSAMADKASREQAAGISPKAKMTFTDEGVEFESKEARDAYFAELGQRVGASPMSREGFTNTKASISEGNEHAAKINAAESPERRAMRRRASTAVSEAMDIVRGAKEDSPNLFNRDASLNPNLGLGNLNLDGAANVFKDVLASTAGTAASLRKGDTEQQPATTPPSQATGTAVNTPTTPQVVQQPNVRVGGKIKNDISVREHGEGSWKYKEGDIDIQDPVIGTTTTRTQSARIDDVRTNFWDLMALKSSEDMSNSAIRAANPMATFEKGIFEKALEKREADLLRWETAATMDGTKESVSEIGKRVYKTGGNEYQGESRFKDSYGQGISFAPIINLTGVKDGSGGPKEPNEIRTLGTKSGRSNEDWVQVGNEIKWIQSLGHDDLEPTFKVNQGGKTQLDIQAFFNQIVRNISKGSRAPWEKNIYIEVGHGNDIAFYDPQKKKFYTGHDRKTERPMPKSINYTKVWNPEISNEEPIANMDAEDFTMVNFSEKLANNIIAKWRTGALSGTSLNQNKP